MSIPARPSRSPAAPDPPPGPCPLCLHPAASRLHTSPTRTFWRCSQCALIFIPPALRPNPAAEKARYDRHHNDPLDPGWQRFLRPLADALIAATRPAAAGLEFGCGPASALAHLLIAAGLQVTPYDPFYAPDETVWTRRYDFIAAAEVVEHLHDPRREFERLIRTLQPGGVLGIMTGWAPPEAAEFADWHYIRDLTHVAFFSQPVFEYIARTWKMSLEFPATSVALLRSPAESP